MLKVELMQARSTGMGNLGLARRAGLNGRIYSSEGERGGPGESAARAAIQEAADLRRYGVCVLSLLHTVGARQVDVRTLM